MDPELFRRVKAIFDEAVELPPDEREAFILARCADHPTVHEAVLDLLRHDRTGDDLLRPRAPDSTHAPTSAESPGTPTLPPGATVGGFTIDAVLGVGGFGVVYRARQERPSRDVALKLIRPGVASPRLLRRFELEAELLARLQHPGIAHVYETGTLETPAGTQPYFAMELVDGRPLDRYVEEHHLPTKARLRLFADICDAVHHAHAKGILHRDLKPSNILITPEGKPKILDFGVARALDSDIQLTTIQTEVGQLIGTVPYMSPEQAAADPDALDTRSDVYTLGVVLYEMLTGRLPYDLRKRMIHEAIRVIREEDPTRLSSVSKAFRGDIEIITGKALEKEPDRRYQSAADLAADVRRHLADQPIIARPPSTTYQIRKFARRNKALVAGLAATFVVLVAGVVATTTFAVGQARERRAAERELVRANETKNFIASILGAVSPEIAQDRDTALLRLILDNATGRTESLADPEINADIKALIGQTYFMIGDQDTGIRLMAEALDTRERVLGPDHRLTLELMSDIAEKRGHAGQHEDAVALSRRAYEGLLEQLGPEHTSTVLAQRAHGSCLFNAGMLDEGLRHCQQAFEKAARVFGPDHESTITARNDLARALNEVGRPEEAIDHLEEIVRIRLEKLGPKHPYTNQSTYNLATSYFFLHRLDEAERVMKESLAHARDIYDPDHPQILFRLNALGVLYPRMGRHEDGLPFAREAFEMRVRTHGESDPNTLASMSNLGALLADVGELGEAERLARRAVELGAEVLPPGHFYLGHFHDKLGMILLKAARFDEAEASFLDAHRVFLDAFGPDHMHTQRVVTSLAELHDAWHEVDRGAGHDAEAARWRAMRTAPAADGPAE